MAVSCKNCKLHKPVVDQPNTRPAKSLSFLQRLLHLCLRWFWNAQRLGEGKRCRERNDWREREERRRPFRYSVHSMRAFRFKNVAKMEGLQTEQPPQLQICWLKLHVQWPSKGWVKGQFSGKIYSRPSRVVPRELQRTHETTPTTAFGNVSNNREWAAVLDFVKNTPRDLTKARTFFSRWCIIIKLLMANSHSKVIMNTFIPLMSR